MSNTSFSKISELLMPERTADTRSPKSGSKGASNSGEAVQRFEQLLQTASKQRPHRPESPEARRGDNRPKPVGRADRQPPSTDHFDRADRPDNARQTEPSKGDSGRIDDRERAEDGSRADSDASSVSNADRDLRDADNRVSSDDEHTNEGRTDEAETEASTSDEVSTADVETIVSSAATDQAGDLLLDDAGEQGAEDTSVDERSIAEAVAGDSDAPEGLVVEDASATSVGQTETDADLEVEADSESGEAGDAEQVDGGSLTVEDLSSADQDADDQSNRDQDLEDQDRDASAAATNNAAAAQVATTPSVTETETETEVEVEVEVDVALNDVEAAVVAASGEASTEVGAEADAAPGIAPLQEDGSIENDATEGTEVESADGGEADQSNLDGEAQPEQQQTDGGDAAEAAPAAAPVQVATAQATAQTNTAATALAGLAEVSGTGEIGPASSSQVAGAAPSEQADGADPLWRQVRRAMGSIRNLPTGEQQLTIRLRPNDLGSVTVRISTGESGTTVALVADSAAAASQLNQQRQQLIRELEDGGLRGVAVDVGTSGDTEQSNGDEDSEVGQSGLANDAATGGTSTDNGPARAYSGRRDGRIGEGLIDVDL